MRVNSARLNSWSFNRQHFDDFIHTRLWISVPVVVIVMFAIVVVKEAVLGSDDMSASMLDGLMCGALMALIWIIGIWAATGPDPEPTEEDEMDAKGKLWLNSLPRPLGLSLRILFVVLGVSAIFCFEIIEIVAGDMSLTEALMSMFLKVLAVSCIIIPIWLSQIGKS